jgi:hypothetical protein
MQNYTQVDSLMSMKNELKESLCNHLAVAGVENVISTDETEVWTLLDLPEPANYDYEADSHTKISTDLIDKIHTGFEPFIEFVEENDGFHAFWNQFSLLPIVLLPTAIDEFNGLMQKILEGIEN